MQKQITWVSLDSQTPIPMISLDSNISSLQIVSSISFWCNGSAWHNLFPPAVVHWPMQLFHSALFSEDQQMQIALLSWWTMHKPRSSFSSQPLPLPVGILWASAQAGWGIALCSPFPCPQYCKGSLPPHFKLYLFLWNWTLRSSLLPRFLGPAKENRSKKPILAASEL